MSERPYIRIHNMTAKHRYNVLHHLTQRYGDVTGGRIENFSSAPDYFEASISNYIKKYTPEQIDAAHYDVRASYPNTRIWKRGRPVGAKNKNKHRHNFSNERFREEYGSNLEASSVDAVHSDTGLDDILEAITTDETSADETSADETSAITTTTASTAFDAEALKNMLRDYVTHSQLEDVARNIQTSLEPIYNRHEVELKTLKNAYDRLAASKPTIVEIKAPNVPETKKLGIQHKQFPTLLNLCNTRMPNGNRLAIWLYGPAGTGKSTAVENVARALNLQFYTNGKLSSEHQILGYKDANGNYHTTQFRQAYEHGGAYLADEIDSWYPDATISLNNALANGHMAFPDKLVERHPDFIFIGAANTTGLGGTHEYVGRMKQDAATNDRFVYLHWPIDDALEAHMSGGNADWLDRVRHVRVKVAEKGVKGHLITPRATLFGATLLAAGFPLETVYEMALKKGMSDAQWEMVRPSW